MKNNIEHITKDYTLEAKADVIIVNGETFTYKSSGLTRRVFANASKTQVVKVPITYFDQVQNNEEIEIFKNASDEKKGLIAHTEILDNGYIVQEYLQTLDDPTTEEWLKRPMTMSEIRFANSCRRDVGFDKDGVLKCFDLPEYKQY
jgi:hypothetical protein